MNKKQLAGGLVSWLGFTGSSRQLAFVPEPEGYARLLAFFSEALADLRRYGKASRRLVELSRPDVAAALGPRAKRTRLIETVLLRAEAVNSESTISDEGATVTWTLDESGLVELVDATRLQAEPTQRFFHGSFTSWGFGYAIDWAGAE